MVVSERGTQARRGINSQQARVRSSAALMAAGWLLAGCSTLSSMNPVNWWHRQEGGKIAEQRPAPPGADQPYPNIATVPPKPDAPDADALRKLTDSLVADRTNAQHAAQSAPLADPSSPTASPSLFGVGTAPPPPPPTVKSPTASASPGASSGPSVASASMPAVTAPPAPAAPPSAAPRRPVQSAPLEAPTQTPAATDSASAVTASPPAPDLAQPALPSGPPVRANAAGAPPGAPPAMPPPMPAPSSGPSATIVFLERASNLSPPAADEVKAFAAKRGTGTISVTGYGDSASSDPDAQSAALNLGLTRAQSIVNALKAAGVPGTAIRVSAEASGRGASLNLLQ
jgi:outer membrane protein OmpA-like peptidoglycan-associated protein